MSVTESATQTSLELHWLNDLFVSIDAKDAEAFAGFLSDDAVFVFGNAPPVAGRATIIDAVSGFFSSIKALSHTLRQVVSQPGIVVCWGTVTYTRHDGSDLTVPFADTFALENDKISHYQIYMDIGQLYAA